MQVVSGSREHWARLGTGVRGGGERCGWGRMRRGELRGGGALHQSHMGEDRWTDKQTPGCPARLVCQLEAGGKPSASQARQARQDFSLSGSSVRLSGHRHPPEQRAPLSNVVWSSTANDRAAERPKRQVGIRHTLARLDAHPSPSHPIFKVRLRLAWAFCVGCRVSEPSWWSWMETWLAPPRSPGGIGTCMDPYGQHPTQLTRASRVRSDYSCAREGNLDSAGRAVAGVG